MNALKLTWRPIHRRGPNFNPPVNKTLKNISRIYYFELENKTHEYFIEQSILSIMQYCVVIEINLLMNFGVSLILHEYMNGIYQTNNLEIYII